MATYFCRVGITLAVWRQACLRRRICASVKTLPMSLSWLVLRWLGSRAVCLENFLFPSWTGYQAQFAMPKPSFA